MQEIKWGIIGTGKIANALAYAINLVEGTSVKAVASRQLEKAKSFCEEYNIPNYYGSYKELAASSEIDIIYVATPHVYHYENTMMCLNAGKSVLCEKPFGMNAKQVKEMTDLARQKQLFLMEAMWTRFIPATEKMLALIEEGRIGKVQDVRADFGFPAEFNPD